jgi:hypothetical protein
MFSAHLSYASPSICNVPPGHKINLRGTLLIYRCYAAHTLLITSTFLIGVIYGDSVMRIVGEFSFTHKK